MPTEINVPDHLSLEGRAVMIADECGRIQHAGKPEDRRRHVEAVALAHLRAALDQVGRAYRAEHAESMDVSGAA